MCPVRRGREMLDFGRLIRAVRYSCRGLRDAFLDEAARQEAVLALILIPVAVWLGEDNVERALMMAFSSWCSSWSC